MHGFALDRRCWHFQRRMLAGLTDPAVRVVLYDQRRHGRSGQCSARACTIAQLGADLDTVIRTVAPEGDLVLVGHSMGGMTIMALAERHPALFRDRVLGVALVNTSAGDVGTVGLQRAVPVAPQPGGQRRRAARALAPGDASTASAGSAATPCGRPCGGCPSATPTSSRRWSTSSTGRSPRPRWPCSPSFANTLSTHDRKAALRGLSQCEVLVAAGTDDRMIPYSHSEVIAAELPRAELLPLEGAGHMAMLEQPGEFDAALLELLRRCTHRSQVLRRLHPQESGAAPRRPRLRRPRRRA